MFKTRKRADVDVERVAHGHRVRQRERKENLKISVLQTALVVPIPCLWFSKSVPKGATVDWEI